MLRDLSVEFQKNLKRVFRYLYEEFFETKRKYQILPNQLLINFALFELIRGGISTTPLCLREK